MNLEPLNGYVLVDPDNNEKSAGGIFMAGAENLPLQKGKVLVCSVNIGNSGTAIDTEMKKINPGDSVYYFSMSANELTHNGKKVLVLRVADLVAKVLGDDDA